jgi:hypothetical protein
LVTDTRAHWWTLDLANASLSPGVNSLGGLVPSHGASRRRLGEKQRLNSENSHNSHATAVAMATMTFQYGGYFCFEVI